MNLRLLGDIEITYQFASIFCTWHCRNACQSQHQKKKENHMAIRNHWICGVVSLGLLGDNKITHQFAYESTFCPWQYRLVPVKAIIKRKEEAHKAIQNHRLYGEVNFETVWSNRFYFPVRLFCSCQSHKKKGNGDLKRLKPLPKIQIRLNSKNNWL